MISSMAENILIRQATTKDASAIVNAAKKIAKNPGFFVSLPNELNKQNVIKNIETLEESQEGVYLVAEVNGKIVGHSFLAPLHQINLPCC